MGSPINSRMRHSLLLFALAAACIHASTIPECCKEKTVGKVDYRLVAETDTGIYGCKSNCVFEKKDSPGPRFCFKDGDLEVVCDGGGAENIVNDYCTASASNGKCVLVNNFCEKDQQAPVVTGEPPNCECNCVLNFCSARLDPDDNECIVNIDRCRVPGFMYPLAS